MFAEQVHTAFIAKASSGSAVLSMGPDDFDSVMGCNLLRRLRRAQYCSRGRGSVPNEVARTFLRCCESYSSHHFAAEESIAFLRGREVQHLSCSVKFVYLEQLEHPISVLSITMQKAQNQSPRSPLQDIAGTAVNQTTDASLSPPQSPTKPTRRSLRLSVGASRLQGPAAPGHVSTQTLAAQASAPTVQATAPTAQAPAPTQAARAPAAHAPVVRLPAVLPSMQAPTRQISSITGPRVPPSGAHGPELGTASATSVRCLPPSH